MKRVRPTEPAFGEDDIRTLAGILREFGLSELELDRHGERIRLRGGGDHTTAHGAAHAPAHVVAPVAPAPTKAAPPVEEVDEASYITSPFVGTFYRSPSPEAAAYVDVGQVVKKGQVLCIIEAMKLMNEIEAEVEGKILAVLVQNGRPVEYGEPLFKIGPA